VNWMTV